MNGTCTVQSKDIRLTYDFVYKTDLNLVFDNTEVQCITTTMKPCNLQMRIKGATNITLMNQSKFTGK